MTIPARRLRWSDKTVLGKIASRPWSGWSARRADDRQTRDCHRLRALREDIRLLRQWQGSTHEVIVQEDGVRYRGETYRSLSEVARIITGARWSGPLFFGLKERRRDVG